MFKVGLLKDAIDENIKITKETGEYIKYVDGKKEIEPFNYLSFNITSKKYNFYFETNDNYQELLECKMLELIDFKYYINQSEVFFQSNDSNGCEPDYKIKIRRLVKNKFGITINFLCDNCESVYAGKIEFEFNLDDYL